MLMGGNMKETALKIIEVEEIIHKNDSILDLMQGYCVNTSQEVNQMHSLITAF